MNKNDIRYLRELHAEEIAFTDYHIGRILEQIEALGISNSTLVVFTADHGEEFMEHEWIGHTRTLYNELINIPLVFYLPGKIKPSVVDTLVSQVDISPTIIQLTAGKEDSSMQGLSLVPLLKGENDPAFDRVLHTEVSFSSSSETKEAYKTASIRNNLKVIHDETTDTYECLDMVNDPAEKKNVCSEKAQIFKELTQDLKQWSKSRPALNAPSEDKVDRDAKEIEQLESLGYM